MQLAFSPAKYNEHFPEQGQQLNLTSPHRCIATHTSRFRALHEQKLCQGAASQGNLSNEFTNSNSAAYPDPDAQQPLPLVQSPSAAAAPLVQQSAATQQDGAQEDLGCLQGRPTSPVPGGASGAQAEDTAPGPQHVNE